jgi:predicted AlkP superfamily pyrophosphatase or phosphodiesterase
MKLRRLLLVSLLAFLVHSSCRGPSRPATTESAPPLPGRPRLVLLIAVDQLRYDYLTRFRPDFTGGFWRLLNQGASFSNAYLEHYPSVTAVGHSTMLSGAPPSMSGIIGNDWYDRGEKKNVTSVSDPAVLGLAGVSAASPHRLLVSTIGDELKMAGRESRVIGLSLKDRSAILTVGRMADGAFWYDTATGGFGSSTWYAPDLPAWVKEFNARHPADAFAGKTWVGGTLPEVGPNLYGAVYSSPFGNELLAELAEAALTAEKLGTRETVDLLSVSFSSNDAVGHDKGPDSPEVADLTKRTDAILARLLASVDQKIGPSRTLVILTADHGVAPLPELMAERRMPGGRLLRKDLVDPVDAALVWAYGAGKWVEGRAGSSLYLNRTLMKDKHLDPRLVEETAARAAERIPHVYCAFTRSQLSRGDVPQNPWTSRLLAGFNPERSGDVEILLDPYWIGQESGTSHGTPYSYDTHIPLVFMGPGVRPGRYDAAVAMNDIAPTLATMLDIETPSGSTGRVLTEMLVR